MTSIRQILIDIQESRSFEKLEPFKQASVWKSFPQEERLLLARLIVMQGALQLAKTDNRVLESFEIASHISSQAPEILYEQGCILSSYSDNIRCLNLASQAFALALQQVPTLSKGWYLRAQVLTAIGLFESDGSYLVEAHQNFEKAQTFLDNSEESINREEFFWKWGFCLASLGKVSGEPLDFHQAITKYRLAYDLGCYDVKFFNDFGHCFAGIGSLLENPEYFGEALKLFNRAILKDPLAFEGWYNQACCIQSLIEFMPHDKLLEQADQSFAQAAEVNPLCSQLWLKWGQLETTIGKIKHDQQKIESSLEKFEKANQLESGHPHILSCWAEAELFLGAQEERLDLLQSAQLKILKSLKIQPEDPDVWYLYGSCLNEFGRYFDDEGHYNQAIEKFQYGLSLSRKHPLLWYGLALAHFALGELTEQKDLFEKAIRHFSRVIECGGGFAQFWNDWGVALMKLGELTQQVSYVEAAIEKFEQALKQPIQNIDGEDVDLEWVCNYGSAYDLLGDLTEELCHFERAVQVLTQVIQLDPDYHQAHYSLALALSHVGEAMFDVESYQKAIEHFQYLLDQNPEDEMIHLDFGISLINLALIVHDNYHPERSQALYHQAENHLMQAAALGNTQSYYQLAGLYSITGHYDQAMHYLERAQFFGTLPPIEDLLHDDWLEELRQMPAFRQFINELSSQQPIDDK
jgi:tetratricopeptide (TPR) repeat protein